jgi:hypothetical protein
MNSAPNSGAVTLLKYGGPSVIFSPMNNSVKIGA